MDLFKPRGSSFSTLFLTHEIFFFLSAFGKMFRNEEIPRDV